MKAVAALTVSIKQSPRLLLIQSVAHAVAGLSVLAANISPWLAVVILIAIGASLARQGRQQELERLIFHGDGRIEIVGSDETVIESRMHPHTLVWSFLVVLLYRQNNRVRSIVLLPDSADYDELRQLRIWLRWRPSAVIQT
ncbi:MAG: hypothetical protein K9J74_00985 [Sulfuritalea sp.]|nr:hypothetical protein [Sulfuritalea sp.]